MYKKISYILLIFVCFLSFCFGVDALEKDAYISCSVVTSNLNLRTSIDGDVVAKVSCGNDLVVLDDTLGSTSICDNWYKIRYNNNEYYACGDYITIRESLSEEDEEEYREYLKNLGFPDSYLDSLVDLHEKYPAWQFRVFDTNLDWNTAVDNEAVKNRSLIYKSYGEGYRSLESYSYNWETDEFYRHPSETNWWYASRDAVSYYMDPRNFLTERNIFQFEALSYQPTFQTASLIGRVLDNSFMPSLYSNYFDTSYTDAFLDGADTYKISPVHLATRILQENGSSGSTSSRGYFTYNGVTYNHVFNFYNIRATGVDPAIQGLIWAMGGLDGSGTSYGRPWNNPYKSIVGGAQFLSEGYISVGQDTMYFQKFDVSTTNGHYTHQYMQNIGAPVSEASSTYNAYSEISGLFEESLVFILPVYDNMPESKVDAPVNGNPNYYLDELKFDGVSAENFVYNKSDYTYYTKNEYIDISTSTINDNASVSGDGKIKVEIGENNLDLVVTAQNGKTFTYNIKVVREDINTEEEEEVSLNQILDNSGIKYNDEFIYGINPDTNVSSLIENIKKISSNAGVSIKNKDNENKIDSVFATGDTVSVTIGDETKTFNVVIYGDINGDGVIDKLDYLQVLRYYYQYSTLENSYLEAADANKDGVVDKLDYLAILRDYYGYSEIIQ